MLLNTLGAVFGDILHDTTRDVISDEESESDESSSHDEANRRQQPNSRSRRDLLEHSDVPCRQDHGNAVGYTPLVAPAILLNKRSWQGRSFRP